MKDNKTNNQIAKYQKLIAVQDNQFSLRDPAVVLWEWEYNGFFKRTLRWLFTLMSHVEDGWVLPSVLNEH